MRTWIRFTGWMVSTMIGVAAGMILSPTLAVAAKEPPQEWDGLQRVEDKGPDHLYILPTADFSGYKQVRVDQVVVEFDKKFDPNQGSVGLQMRMTDADLEKLRTDVAKAFHDVFEEQLKEQGYTVAQQPGGEVLQLRPAIVNLYVSAPGAISKGSSASRSYVEQSGHMTLVLELRDSVSGQLLGRVVDNEQGMRDISFRTANAATNTADAHAAFNTWAKATVTALAYAKSTSGKAVAQKSGSGAPR